ncbi:uncharacterized protein LOC144084089 isoform X2 [Stigmatopora argus]
MEMQTVCTTGVTQVWQKATRGGATWHPWTPKTSPTRWRVEWTPAPNRTSGVVVPPWLPVVKPRRRTLSVWPPAIPRGWRRTSRVAAATSAPTRPRSDVGLKKTKSEKTRKNPTTKPVKDATRPS